MSFLGNNEILKRFDELFIDGDRNGVRQASYDLRLGREVYVVGQDVPKRLTLVKPYMVLRPGEFAILTCAETLKMPRDLVGFITVRMRYKNQGLVNISGFHVDATYCGILKFAVQNVGPNDIHLKYNEPTFSILFACIDGDVGRDREDPSGPAIRLDDVQLLGGSSVTLSHLKKEVDQLRQVMLVYAPFAVSAFIALLILIFRMLTGKG
jgi:dCTP deaminase